VPIETSPPVPAGLVMTMLPSALASPIGKPIVSQPSTARQSVKVPPVIWVLHSSRCPASVPAASRS
jgi:hypothetical protein